MECVTLAHHFVVCLGGRDSISTTIPKTKATRHRLDDMIEEYG